MHTVCICVCAVLCTLKKLTDFHDLAMNFMTLSATFSPFHYVALTKTLHNFGS